MRQQLESFVSGQPLQDLPQLQRLVYSMQFMPVAGLSDCDISLMRVHQERFNWVFIRLGPL